MQDGTRLDPPLLSTPRAAAAPLADAEPRRSLQPLKKKRKKKKRKKEGFLSKMLGRATLASAEALVVLGEAFVDAGDKYARRHRKSRDKRRGGWRRDLGKNLGSAAGTLVSRSAKAPARYIKIIVRSDKADRKRSRRRIDESVRSVLLPAQDDALPERL